MTHVMLSKNMMLLNVHRSVKPWKKASLPKIVQGMRACINVVSGIKLVNINSNKGATFKYKEAISFLGVTRSFVMNVDSVAPCPCAQQLKELFTKDPNT